MVRSGHHVAAGVPPSSIPAMSDTHDSAKPGHTGKPGKVVKPLPGDPDGSLQPAE